MVDKLKATLAESVGVEADELVLAYTGPDLRLWVLASAAVGGILFGIVGLGGAIGGGLVGAVVGSWFLIAKPYAVAVAAESTYLVRMSQRPFGGVEAEEVVRRDAKGAGIISREGRNLYYEKMELQVLLTWRGRADAVAEAARDEPSRG